VIGSRHVDNDVLADYLEGLLAGRDRVAVAAHLAECETCAAARDQFSQLRMVLSRAAADPEPMPPALAARLDAVLDAEVRNRPASRSSSRVTAVSRARHRKRPSRTPRLLAAAASVAVLGAAGAAAYLVFGAGVVGTGNTPEAGEAPSAEHSSTPRAAPGYSFKEGDANLTSAGFADQVDDLVGPGAPASNETKFGPKSDGPGKGIVPPETTRLCVTQVLKAKKAGKVLDTKVGRLDGQPVSLAITSTGDAQIVRLYAVQGCPGMKADVVETADIRVP
jgi:Putative zinc-finger